MTTKVKRGLGLLVVAVLCWLVGLVLDRAGAPQLLLLPFALGLIGCGLIGLVLIAWGLLVGERVGRQDA